MNVRGVLRSRLRMTRNGWGRPRGARAAGRSRRGHPGVALGLTLALAAIFFYGFSTLFGALAAGGARPGDVAPVLALVLSAALTGMLVFDVHHAVASMLLDPDLDWFRRAPLSARAMFAIKLVDSLPRTAALLVVLGLPALGAWAERWPMPAWSLALTPVWLGALWAIPMGLGTALGMLLLRVVPPRAARAALGLLSTLTLVVLWLGNSFLLPQIVEQGDSLVASLRAGGGIDPWLAAASPGHGIALAMTAAAGGEPARALLVSLWLTVFGALSLALAAAAAHATFGAVQSALAAPPGRGRRARPRRGAAPAPGGLVRAVLARDLRLYTRDWTVLGDILTAAVLWTLLPVLSAQLITATPSLMVRAMLVALTVGLGYEIAARAAPFERGAIVWARISPVRPLDWVRARLLATAVMALPVFLAATALLAVTVPLPPWQWVEILSVGLSALAVALSLGLWTGLVFGDPDWTNPRAMLTVSGRIVATGLLLAQAAAWIGWSTFAWLRPETGRVAVALVPPAVALVVTLAASRLAARRLSGPGQRH